MTFVNVGTLGTQPGQREAVVAILTRANPQLAQAGCLLYEVGTSEESPDTVFVTELWTSAEAHQESLQLPSVREATWWHLRQCEMSKSRRRLRPRTTRGRTGCAEALRRHQTSWLSICC